MLALALLCPIVGPTMAAAAELPVIRCGEGRRAHIDHDGTASFTVEVPGRPVVVIDAIDPTGALGLLNVEGGGEESCTGKISFNYSEPTEVTVRDCFNDDSGDFYVSANVISEGPANCGSPMPCGSVPSVRPVRQKGKVDSYTFYAASGTPVTVHARPLANSGAGMRVRVFDPTGTPASESESCGANLTFTASRTGVYTALVSSCDSRNGGFFELSVEASSCPRGPEVTQFAIAKADGTPLTADGYDMSGRPVFERDTGSGFLLYLEARPGSNRQMVAPIAYESDAGLPDIQLLFSRPLGNGSPMVCDATRPNIGGVPATPTLRFDDQTPAVVDAINDFGCRFDDGTGAARGVSSQDACTFFPNGDFHFVDPSSSLQFCALMSQPWSFPSGRTIVKARARDIAGNVGPEREIALQVGPAVPTCSGDCDGDGLVTVDELIIVVRVALDQLSLDQCQLTDTNGDGVITIDELIGAVNNALIGCDN